MPRATLVLTLEDVVEDRRVLHHHHRQKGHHHRRRHWRPGFEAQDTLATRPLDTSDMGRPTASGGRRRRASSEFTSSRRRPTKWRFSTATQHPRPVEAGCLNPRQRDRPTRRCDSNRSQPDDSTQGRSCGRERRVHKQVTCSEAPSKRRSRGCTSSTTSERRAQLGPAASIGVRSNGPSRGTTIDILDDRIPNNRRSRRDCRAVSGSRSPGAAHGCGDFARPATAIQRSRARPRGGGGNRNRLI